MSPSQHPIGGGQMLHNSDDNDDVTLFIMRSAVAHLVENKTGNHRVASLRPTGVFVLCPSAGHFICCLVLV